MKNDQTNAKRGRRAFLRGTGAAITAALAPAAAGAALTGGETRPSASAGDAAAIRQLYQDYAARLASGPAEDLMALFTQDGEALLDRRRFADRETVQLRLLQDPAQPTDSVEVSADGRSARARFHCLAQTAAPLSGNSTVVEMARLQGQYKTTWWEGGVHSLDCVKTRDGWKIRRLTYSKTADSAQLQA